MLAGFLSEHKALALLWAMGGSALEVSSVPKQARMYAFTFVVVLNIKRYGHRQI